MQLPELFGGIPSGGLLAASSFLIGIPVGWGARVPGPQTLRARVVFL